MSLFTNDSIASLEPHTTAKIRSTQILTSLSQLVSELVQNSLDAGASHVEVGIDPAEWECWVRDDGHGISVEGMESLTRGHDKGRYNTSKTYGSHHIETNTFGFRGEALASAMELACLEISSRTPQARESWAANNYILALLSVGEEKRWEQPLCAETFSLIRRSHQNTARTLELAKREIETLALVFPGVSFSLEHTSSAQKARILTIPKASSSLATFRALYGKAVVERVEEINLRSEDLTLDGFISLSGSHSRGLQHFYVNKHPMNYGEIQRAIEKRFATSAFGRFAANEEDARFTAHPHRSPRKTERKPVYVLNLTIATNQVDNLFDPAKSTDINRVVAFALEVINRFLARNGLISALPTRLNEASKTDRCPGSPRKRMRLETPRPTLPTDELPSLEAINRSRDETLSHPSRPLSTHQDEDGTRMHGAQDNFGYVRWTDPSLGESFLIDANTGNSVAESHISGYMRGEGCSKDDNPDEFATGPNRRALKSNEHHAETRSAPPAWLANALKRNTTFTAVGQAVFATPTINPGTQRSQTDAHLRQPLDGICVSNTFQSSQITSQTFSREDLKVSQVIAQVDTKFVACILLPSSKSRRVLALIDQHAADERVRVERYLKEICSGFLRDEVVKLELKPSIKVLLTRREAELLERTQMRGALLRWGLGIDRCALWSEAGLAQDHGFIQVDVTTLPKVVSKRLVTRHEISEFTKAMIAALEIDGFSQWPPTSLANRDGSWVKALRFCPAPLFELINSRACRGAIMFNDPLDQPQCQRLITQLAGTVFPFQCAHGRPSIAPLVKLDNTVHQRDPIDWRAFELEDV